MPQTPQSFLIVPGFENAEFSNTDTQGGPSYGVGIPNKNNTGSLTVLGTGTPTNDNPDDLTLRVQNSGSIGNTSFVWKKTSESVDDYQGEHDRRYTHTFSDPYFNNTFDNGLYGYGLAFGYAPNEEREFCIVVDQGNYINTVQVAYRNAFSTNRYERNSGWIKTSKNLRTDFDRGIGYGGSGANANAQIATCTLDNGTCLIFVQYNGDIDVYSTDDATEWTLIAQSIVGRFADFEDNLFTIYNQLQCASSGNYVKLAWCRRVTQTVSYTINVPLVGSQTFTSEQDGFVITTLTSSDRGLTWSLTDNILGSTDESDTYKFVGETTTSGSDRFAYSLCGLSDNTKGFTLANVDTQSNVIRIYTSTSMNAMAENTSLAVPYSLLNTNAPVVCLAKGHDSIFLHIDYVLQSTRMLESPNAEQLNGAIPAYSETMSGEQRLLMIGLDRSLENASWNDLSEYPFSLYESGFKLDPTVSGFLGSRRNRFYRARMLQMGSGLALVASLRDKKYIGANGEIPNVIYFRLGSFDTRPVNDFYDDATLLGDSHPKNKQQPSYSLWSPQWECWQGAPAGLLNASEDGLWTETRTNATRRWRTDCLTITNQTTGTEKLYYEFQSSYGEYRPQTAQGFGTPPKNWLFSTNERDFQSPENATSGVVKSSSGACFEWSCRVSTDKGSQTRPSCAVRIDGYVGRYQRTDNQDAAKTSVIEIRMYRDQVIVYDVIADSALDTIDLTSEEQDLRDFYEFRLGSLPNKISSTPRLAFMLRLAGETKWLVSSALIIPSTSTQAIDGNTMYQRVRFGCLNTTNTQGTYQEWRYFRIHNGNDLGTLALCDLATYNPLPDCLRGMPITNNLVYLTLGQYAVWSGSSGAENDLFELKTEYAYGSENVLQSNSPRQQWRSAGQTTSMETTFAFSSDENDRVKREFVSGLGIVGTNAKTITLLGQTTSAFTTLMTIDFETSKGRVVNSSTDEHTFEIEFDQGSIPKPGEYISSSTKGGRKWYARFGAIGSGSSGIATNDHHTIVDHFDGSTVRKQYVELSDLATNVTIGAGTTVIVYRDRGYGAISGTRSSKAYKLSAVGTGTEIENYLYCGSIVCGNTLNVSKLLDWDHTVDEQSNNTMFNSRSGITWGYNEGPNRRSISGRLIGDVTDQTRNRVKNNIRRATDFNRRPVFFVLQDGSQSPDMMFFGNVELGSNDNSGYFYDENSGEWRSVGDMTLTIIENI